MSKASPTSRSKQFAEKVGWRVGIVEKWIPYIKRRVDLWNFADIIAMRPGSGILLIQATGGDGGNHAARRNKIIINPDAAMWLAAGGLIEVWSWRKSGPRGAVKKWTLRRESITSDEMLVGFEPTEEPEPLGTVDA